MLGVVRQAEAQVLSDQFANKEYQPTSGHASFCRLSRELAFGPQSQAVIDERVVTVQCLSGMKLAIKQEERKELTPTAAVAHRHRLPEGGR